MKLSNQNRAVHWLRRLPRHNTVDLCTHLHRSLRRNPICLPKKETFNQDQWNNCAIFCRLSVYFVRIKLAILLSLIRSLMGSARLSHLIITQSSFFRVSLKKYVHIINVINIFTVIAVKYFRKSYQFYRFYTVPPDNFTDL